VTYYVENNGRGRIWGALSVLLYIGACVAVMFITYIVESPKPEATILVDFGSEGITGGAAKTTLEEAAQAAPVNSNAAVAPEQILTTDDENAPEIAATTTRPKPVEQPKPIPEPVREVNKKALFPGTSGSAQGSSQSSAGAGKGSGGAGEQGQGTGVSGAGGFSLSGRYLVGNLPRPGYTVDAEGRVVIRITVDASGAVTSAVYEQSGSTTNRGELVDAARTAALKARFTAAETQVQTGTITYIFKLN
jgi:TonB family protein